MSSQSHGGQSHHPTFKQYVLIAIILFAITLVEFFIIWPTNHIGAASTPVLIILSLLKFAIVIGYYMHLRFDPQMFTWIFLGGLVLGISVSLALMFLFSSVYATPEPRAFAAANAVPYVHGEEAHAPAAKTPHEPIVDAPTQPEPEPPAEPVGGADLVAEGQSLFTGVGGCGACHTVEGISAGALGPDLTHIGTDAATRKSGMSAEAYLFESIRNPTAFVPDGVPRATPGLMTEAVTSGLSDEQVNALVQYLLAQK